MPITLTSSGFQLGYSPHIDGLVVFCRAQKDIRRPIPKRHHFVGIGLGRNGLGSSQTEIGELQFALVVDQEILRLEIPEKVGVDDFGFEIILFTVLGSKIKN